MQSVPNHESWKIITSGTIPPDPTRLLSSKKMKQFVDFLSANEDFDLVIFDTPPVAGLADSALVGGLCDGLIYVVSLENVNKGIFKESLNRLNSLGTSVLGLITNETAKPLKSTTAINDYANGYKNVYASYFSNDEDELDKKKNDQKNRKIKEFFKKF